MGAYSRTLAGRNATEPVTNVIATTATYSSCKDGCIKEDIAFTKTQVFPGDITVSSCFGSMNTTLTARVTTLNTRARTFTRTEVSTIEAALTNCSAGACSAIIVSTAPITSKATMIADVATASCKNTKEDTISIETELSTFQTTAASYSSGIYTALTASITTVNTGASTSNKVKPSNLQKTTTNCTAGICIPLTTSVTTVNDDANTLTNTGPSTIENIITSCTGGACTIFTVQIAATTSKTIYQVSETSAATTIAVSSPIFTVNIKTNGAYRLGKTGVFGAAVIAVAAALLI